MKPIIIFKEKTKSGKYAFTEDELKELLEEAYEEGYKDGKSSVPIYPTLNPAPYTIPTYPNPDDTGDKFWWDHQPVTCLSNPKLNSELTSVTAKSDPTVTLRG